jgi:hypothetical protein
MKIIIISISDELKLDHDDRDVVDISEGFGHHAAVRSLLEPPLTTVFSQ